MLRVIGVNDRAVGGALSILVVTYQSAARIGPFLEAAHRIAPSCEIVIVDNASSDGTTVVARDSRREATIVNLDQNVGFGRAANVGAGEATREWLVFANPDVRLDSLTLPAVPARCTFGLGAAMLRLGNGRARARVRADTTYFEDWVREVLTRFLPPPLARLVPGRRWPIAWASGALFVTRRSEFLEVGGFDPRYFLYFEDRDLAARYRQWNRPVRPVPGIVGTHDHGASSSGVPPVQRAAWQLLSWFEYVGIWRGQAAADRAAASALAALREISRLRTWGNAPRRARRKAHEVDELVTLLGTFDERLPTDRYTYYPHARSAMAAAQR